MKAQTGVLWFLCGALCWISACSAYYRPADNYRQPNPFKDPAVRRVAVAPFVFSEKTTEQRYDFDLKGAELSDGRFVVFSVDIARQFSEELALFEGFEVIAPAQVLEAWQQSLRDGDEQNPLLDAASARALARRLKADAIVVGEVRSYDPYEFPRLNLAWQLFYAGHRQAGADDIRELERRGIDGPLRMGHDGNCPIFAGDEIIDCRHERVRASLERYGNGLRNDNTGYASREEAIRKRAWPDYFRFAAWYALTRAFDREIAR